MFSCFSDNAQLFVLCNCFSKKIRAPLLIVNDENLNDVKELAALQLRNINLPSHDFYSTWFNIFVKFSLRVR